MRRFVARRSTRRSAKRHAAPPAGPFAVLLAVTALTVSAGCGDETAEDSPIIRPVRTEQVFATGADRLRSFSGTAEAGMESRLSFKVGGTIRELAVEVGDRIRTGDLIARLDPSDFELQAEDARALVTRREAEARKADADYARFRQLYESRNASRNDLDAARAAAEATRAGVTSAEKNLEMARSQLGYTRLTAPMDGAISSVPVERNENVGAGQVVAVLTSSSFVEVRITVPEALIGQIREGDSATATFDALPGHEFPARVIEVGVSASRAGATYPVRLRLDRTPDDVRPGMAAQVAFRFSEGSGPDRIRVPAFAVLEDRGGRFAFVVERAEPGFGTVRRRDVRVGELGPAGLEILEGLQDGDHVVTAGVTKIQDGLRVRLPETP